MSYFNLEIVLCRPGMDNYAYIISDKESGEAAVVDAPEAEEIINRCNKLNIKPKYILNTHHHFDHTDANVELKEYFGAKVVGSKYEQNKIPAIDVMVEEGEQFKIGDLTADIIKASGHTSGHILWYFKNEKLLFTGDVLFNLCIGGLFEGTPEEMYETLKKIKALPDDVMFYPGHEYTMHGAGMALHYSNGSKEVYSYIERAQKRLEQGLSVCPVSLGEEKRCNPYLMANTLEDFTNLF